MYMARKVVPRPKKAAYRKTFIRQWREHRNNMTLEQLAARIAEINPDLASTHASISRIERGLQPYNQPFLEACAEALQTDVASILFRNPTDPEAIWSVWDQAKPGEKRQIVEIAKTILKTGT